MHSEEALLVKISVWPGFSNKGVCRTKEVVSGDTVRGEGVEPSQAFDPCRFLADQGSRRPDAPANFVTPVGPLRKHAHSFAHCLVEENMQSFVSRL